MNEINLKTMAGQTGIPVARLQVLNSALVADLASVASALDSVAIPGFGTFEGEKNNETIVESEGRRVLTPPSLSIVFKPSVVLRKKLNQ